MRQSLLDFHKKWYSANIMALTVVSPKDLDYLEDYVTKVFSEIENKDVVLPDLGLPDPYPEERLGKLIKMVPIKDKDSMTLIWKMPYLQEDKRSRPLDYHAFLFGHEGEGSLLSYLKELGYATELAARGDHELWSYSNF